MASVVCSRSMSPMRALWWCALAEFVGRVFNLLADPSVGVLLNFQSQPEEALGATGPGLPVRK